MWKYALILTKSIMNGGSCVSGVDMKTGEWVRFVSDANGSPLNAMFMQYQNTEGVCEPLDALRVDVREYVPVRNQTENCRIAVASMHKLMTFSLGNALRLHPPENSKHQYIFGDNGYRISADDMRVHDFRYSLLLVKVERLIIRRIRTSVKTSFNCNGIYYENMSLTDPEYVYGFSNGGLVNLGSKCIVVSMAKKPYNGFYYKFIAKIL